MELPNSDNTVITTLTNSNSETVLAKPVPRPFSIEALMSDSGPTRSNNINNWNLALPQHHYHYNHRDTDSDGSLDLDLAQDLSRRSQKDGKYFIIYLYFSNKNTTLIFYNPTDSRMLFQSHCN